MSDNVTPPEPVTKVTTVSVGNTTVNTYDIPGVPFLYDVTLEPFEDYLARLEAGRDV